MAALPSWAGLSLDEALARDRSLETGQPGMHFGLSPVTLEPTAADGVSFALGGPGNDVPPLLRPTLRGDGGTAIRAHAELAGGRVGVRFGATFWAGDRHPYSLDGSAIGLRLGGGEFYASVERRHWGPGWVSSLILDGGARPVPALGWRTKAARPFETPWLSWIGPWTADLFAGELAERSGPHHPKLLGGRFQFMPFDGLELGLSRVIQWGGSGRPQSLRSLFQAVAGHDNTENANDPDEPGNQLAGFDGRYSLHIGGGRTVSIYGQAIGEDEAGGLPSRYLGMAGADTHFTVGGVSARVFGEFADTSTRGFYKSPLLGLAYRHHIYTDGYTQLGDPLGHPLGGDVRVASVGAFVDAGAWTGTAMVHRGHGYATAQRYAPNARLTGAQAEVARRLDGGSRVGLAVFYWNDGEASRTRGQLWWEAAFR